MSGNAKNHESGGCVTLPIEVGMEKKGFEIARFLGADAVRDCDGVVMPEEITKSGFEIYSTLCLIRADRKWAREHPEARPQRYLMTPRETAGSDKLSIKLMRNFYEEQFEIDTAHDEKKYWEVMDRTAGEIVAPENWHFDSGNGLVTIEAAAAGHEYTVSFLVYIIWDATSMYNYKINKWTGEHAVPVDPRHPGIRGHLLEYLENWLEEHPYTDIVRVTSLNYHFPVIMSSDGNSIQFRDWYGYQECASVYALDEFEKEYGYRLRPEDLVDDGYYRRIDRLPGKSYLDWMDFQHRFVTSWGKEVVSRIHRRGKRAVLFWCDHWIGTEPYGKHFQDMDFDGVVTPSHTGFHVRRIAEFPGKQFRALRLQPYFFSDRFGKGFDNVTKLRGYWIDERRALLRAPVDRISFGGYLSIAAAEKNFIELMKKICDEFRSFHIRTNKEKSYRSPVTVGILNCWGKLRTWQSTGTYIYPIPFVSEFYQGMSGLPFEFVFLSFDDVLNGIPDAIDVIVNIGEAGSSFSGGEVWDNLLLADVLREWVSSGGGFVGIGSPSEWRKDGKLWQMRDVLGVERNVPQITLSERKDHWIFEDLPASDIRLEEKTANVYPVNGQTETLLTLKEGGVLLSVNDFGKGRAAYLSGYRYEPLMTRVIYRLFFWAAKKEEELKKWSSSDSNVEVAYYPRSGVVALVNNSGDTVRTGIYNGTGEKTAVSLEPYELRWINVEELKKFG